MLEACENNIVGAKPLVGNLCHIRVLYLCNIATMSYLGSRYCASSVYISDIISNTATTNLIVVIDVCIYAQLWLLLLCFICLIGQFISIFTYLRQYRTFLIFVFI